MTRIGTMNSAEYRHSPERIVVDRGMEVGERHIPVRYIGEKATGVTVLVEGKPVMHNEADKLFEAAYEEAPSELPLPPELAAIDFEPAYEDLESSAPAGHAKAPKSERPASRPHNSKRRDKK